MQSSVGTAEQHIVQRNVLGCDLMSFWGDGAGPDRATATAASNSNSNSGIYSTTQATLWVVDVVALVAVVVVAVMLRDRPGDLILRTCCT